MTGTPVLSVINDLLQAEGGVGQTQIEKWWSVTVADTQFPSL